MSKKALPSITFQNHWSVYFLNDLLEFKEEESRKQGEKEKKR